MRRLRYGLLAATAALALSGCVTQATVQSQPAAQTQSPVDGGLMAAAQASQQAQNYAGAVAYYGSLYDRNPEDLEAVLGLARSSRYAGDTARATNVIERALASYPDHPDLMAEYGKSLLAANRPQEAIPVLNRAASLAPQDASVHSALGIAYDMLDDRANAIAAYEQALVIAPDDPVTLNNAGLSRALGGDLEGATAYLRRAVQQPRSTAQMRQNLALLLAAGGNLDEAERLVRSDLQPEIADANVAYLRELAAASASGADPTAALPVMPVAAPLPKLTILPATETVTTEPVAEAEPALQQTEEEAEPAAAAAEATADPDPAAAAAASEPAEAATGDTGATGGSTEFSSAAAAAADEAFAEIMGAEGGEAASAAPAYRLQLASYLSPNDAATGRTQLDRELKDVLNGLPIAIITAVLADGSKVYRLMAGPVADKAEATSMCRAIEQRQVACIVQLTGA